MRRSKAGATGGRLDSRLPRHVELAILALLGLVAAWAVSAIAPEAQLYRRMNADAAALQAQNAALQAEDDGYRKEIVEIQSGSAAEEDARRSGYARPDDRLYVVAAAPSPTPTPAPTPGHRPSPRPSPSARPSNHR